MKHVDGFEGVNPAVLAAWRREHTARSHEDPGPDWLSTEQLSRLWGCSDVTARRRLRHLGDRVETAERYVRAAGLHGRQQPIPVYRLKGA